MNLVWLSMLNVPVQWDQMELANTVATLLLHMQENGIAVKTLSSYKRSDAEEKKLEKARSEIRSYSVQRLKNLLKKNGQPVGGSKPELIERVAGMIGYTLQIVLEILTQPTRSAVYNNTSL
jgi:hypothetical protein